jgi:hypothetical protein
MIYFILTKEKSSLNKDIFSLIKKYVQKFFQYEIILLDDDREFLETDLLVNINKTDIIVWHPKLLHGNVKLLKKYQNSIVILERETLFVQKISKEYNPINENMAVNNRFYLFYIYPEKKDITNDDYKLVIDKKHYLLEFMDLFELFMIDNIKNLEGFDLNKFNEEFLTKNKKPIRNKLVRNQIHIT